MKRIVIFVFLFASFIANSQLVEDNYKIKNNSVNTEYVDYGVSFYGDDKVVFASSRKDKSIRKNFWSFNSQPYLQLYEGVIGKNGEIIDVKLFDENINSKLHDADVAFSPDLKTVYFTSNNIENNKLKRDSAGWNLIQLYKAEMGQDGSWENIQKLPFNSDNYNTGHPYISPDGTKLYFISDMPGGFGLTDIYVAYINDDGTYSDPINLGPNINTAGREMFPYISESNYLFFSSNGYENGKGGLDVYFTRMFDEEARPSINAGSPINTPYDDFSFVYQEGRNTGYFSSNRPGGAGDDDIYAFTEINPILMYCTQSISGYVMDEITGDPVTGAQVILYDDLGFEVDRATVYGEDAEFNFEVPCNRGYKVVANKKDYSEDSKEIFLEYGKDAVVPLEISIEEFMVERGKCMIKINPIYFDFDSSEIREDASIELNRVAEVMKKYPEIRIEVGSHTDSRSGDGYNLRLSSRRARATVKYLVDQGIASNRLESKGYGETELANECADGVECSEEDHQFNRRTEFSISNYGEIREIYASICGIETVTAKEQVETMKELEKIEQEKIEALEEFEVVEEAIVEEINNEIEIVEEVKEDVEKVEEVKEEVEVVEKVEEVKEEVEVVDKVEEVKVEDEFKATTGRIKIKLEPIQFELNSSEIDADVQKQLDRVVNLMLKYPKLVVECGAHTDSRAPFQINMDLSINRAETMANYIISKGIEPERIIAKGYGETKLLNKCSEGVRCSEFEHSQNRRVEFIITNPEALKSLDSLKDKD